MMKGHRKNNFSLTGSLSSTGYSAVSQSPLPEMFDKIHNRLITVERPTMIMLSQHKKQKQKQQLSDFSAKNFEAIHILNTFETPKTRAKKVREASVDESYGRSSQRKTNENHFLIRGHSPNIVKSLMGEHLRGFSPNLDLTMDVENNFKTSYSIRDEIHNTSDLNLFRSSYNRGDNATAANFFTNNAKSFTQYARKSNTPYVEIRPSYSRILESPSMATTIVRARTSKTSDVKSPLLKDVQLDKTFNESVDNTQVFDISGKKQRSEVAMNLARQNRKKNNLLAHAYSHQVKKEIIHIRTPNNKEGLKLQKDRKKGQKILLRVLGANSPIHSSEYELKAIHI